ncbi:hypothetical protein GCM10020229_21960 [Kitasatospora albolonga]
MQWHRAGGVRSAQRPAPADVVRPVPVPGGGDLPAVRKDVPGRALGRDEPGGLQRPEAGPVGDGGPGPDGGEAEVTVRQVGDRRRDFGPNDAAPNSRSSPAPRSGARRPGPYRTRPNTAPYPDGP